MKRILSYLIYTLIKIAKEDDTMAEFLAFRIFDRKLEFKRVPAHWKEEVKKILIEMNAEELVNEN